MSRQLSGILPYIVLFALFVAAVLFRPVLPVDETRYMTVAWEMFLHKEYFLPTLNFEAYHHKPPMLFWLINLCWNVFGVSRWAALMPVFAASAAVIFLTQKLTAKILDTKTAARAPWLLLGSVPFLIYSTMLMFDLMMTAISLGILLTFLSHAEKPNLYKLLLAGLLMGLGLLTKGPVMYLYVLWPLFLYPLWKNESNTIPSKNFYTGIFLAFLVSLVIVSFWIIPVLGKTSNQFAFWLLWEQTAGRISGNFNSAHIRPFYFYFMILPAMFLPWLFAPSFWRTLRTVDIKNKSIRFLLCCTVPVFLSFCAISGKQPHYLLPLLPFIVIFMARAMADQKWPKIAAISMVLMMVALQGIGSVTYLPGYDLGKIAAFYQAHKEKDWAFVRNYQGEIGYLARMEKPIESLQLKDLPAWFTSHPDGMAVIRYTEGEDDLDGYTALFSQPYRGRSIGIFRDKKL